MAKLLKEKQRLRRHPIMVLIAILTVTLAVAVITEMTMGWNAPFSPFVLLGCLVVLVGASIYYYQLRYTLSISEKKIKYQLWPYHLRRQQLSWDEIDSCEIVSAPMESRWSGSDIALDTEEENYTLCGRNGLRITTRDNRQIFLGSKKVREKASDLSRLIKRHTS